MSNEWKELEIDNLPPDILTGDYDIEHKANSGWQKSNAQPYEVVSFMCRFHMPYRYRKPEPLPPTHEEIMTIDRYWRGLDEDNDMVWERVTSYLEENHLYYVHDEWKERDYFSGRSFVDGIPPEVTE